MPTLTVTAAAADRALVSLAAVKSDLGIAGTASDAALTSLIDAASARACDICRVAEDQLGRRTFVQEACVATFAADEIRSGPLILPWRIPVIGIVSVSVDGEVIDPAEYDACPMGALLYRQASSGERCGWPRRRTVVTMTVGWANADIPAALSSAVMAMVREQWRGRDRDPRIRSYESPDVESWTVFDPDKITLRDGLPIETAALLDPFRNPT